MTKRRRGRRVSRAVQGTSRHRLVQLIRIPLGGVDEGESRVMVKVESQSTTSMPRCLSSRRGRVQVEPYAYSRVCARKGD